ncbi:RNA polymerase sigma factor (sigma-70 family) [Pararhizobium capsulatum DSM 1112]|uniref:RNA polymerase sigma factor (Sigma-70 family) n=1 Tax=Pararhizobium capsulatum DSM 1112 TaxID=1121113 RepID=A0ABU0BM45_9HYPH|nr:RNA polymerase sigma factor [Pararhizobium capsulatum]MDQ0319319.1 RNA polymerase sigma factor (sigma-70 family) [Pararhizobium capsulatum DSM 1112]
MTTREIHQAIETVFRIERARLIGGLARMVRDIGLAEELAQDALVIALSEWPKTGVPANPGAWLTAAAKRRAIDGFRRREMQARKHAEIGRDIESEQASGVEHIEAAMDDDIGDELLSLIFTACHPVLSPEARAALTLRLIGGLTAQEIARAFLSSEATIAQRIVRAKKTIAKADLVYEVPRGEERRARLESVLSVIYLIFNEGYAATSGPDLIRPTLSLEAQRLGRILAGLMPNEPEVFGLLALMELQSSRFAARVGADGLPVPLDKQNRARWDRLAIRRGLAALEHAHALGGASGPHVLQADLAACHARALKAEDTDWERIAGLYDRLVEVMPSPVVELNRAVAYTMAFGPDAGLEIVEGIEKSGALANYALLPAAKGDFLFRANRLSEAKVKFQEAAALSKNEKEKVFLLIRAADCR